jgi:hypothetical protein
VAKCFKKITDNVRGDESGQIHWPDGPRRGLSDLGLQKTGQLLSLPERIKEFRANHAERAAQVWARIWWKPGEPLPERGRRKFRDRVTNSYFGDECDRAFAFSVDG